LGEGSFGVESMIRVLIVDDEHQLLEAFKKKLSKSGMQVFTAADGREAISIIMREPLDIGLFDIKLLYRRRRTLG
jgi:DNA-binding response OmpR family regulator